MVKRVVQRVFVLRCISGLNTLKIHLLNHLVEVSARFESMSPTEAGPFEHFNVLAEQSTKVTSRRLSTKLRIAVPNLENEMCRVQAAETGEIELHV